MTTKFIEIRDRATLIPALAFDIAGSDHALARRAGFGEIPMVYLVAIAVARCQYDPFAWDNRSYHVAHQWLSEHWAEVTSGDVVDVEFILGETPAPKRSEA